MDAKGNFSLSRLKYNYNKINITRLTTLLVKENRYFQLLHATDNKLYNK